MPPNRQSSRVGRITSAVAGPPMPSSDGTCYFCQQGQHSGLRLREAHDRRSSPARGRSHPSERRLAAVPAPYRSRVGTADVWLLMQHQPADAVGILVDARRHRGRDLQPAGAHCAQPSPRRRRGKMTEGRSSPAWCSAGASTVACASAATTARPRPVPPCARGCHGSARNAHCSASSARGPVRHSSTTHVLREDAHVTGRRPQVCNRMFARRLNMIWRK